MSTEDHTFFNALDGEEERVPELAVPGLHNLLRCLLFQIHRLDLDKGGNAQVHFQGSTILICHGRPGPVLNYLAIVGVSASKGIQNWQRDNFPLP